MGVRPSDKVVCVVLVYGCCQCGWLSPVVMTLTLIYIIMSDNLRHQSRIVTPLRKVCIPFTGLKGGMYEDTISLMWRAAFIPNATSSQ